MASKGTPIVKDFRLSNYEQQLKWVALILGVASSVTIVENWYPLTMFLSLPFCLIWVYCAWLHTERQLKYINILFSLLYTYGIVKYLVS